MTIPEERIDRLETMADEAIRNDEPDRSRAYVRLAKRIAERQRLRFPRPFARHVCPSCDVYLLAGRNARVRLQDGHIVVTCDCGAHARHGYDT